MSIEFLTGGESAEYLSLLREYRATRRKMWLSAFLTVVSIVVALLA